MMLRLLATLLATPVLLAACFHMTPAPAPSASAQKPLPECFALSARLADADARRKAAEYRAKDAYKAVIPVAVAAIYAQNASESANAAKEFDELQRQRVAAGCLA